MHIGPGFCYVPKGWGLEGTPVFFVLGDQVSARVFLEVPKIFIVIDLRNKPSGRGNSGISLKIRILGDIQGVEFIVNKIEPVMTLNAFSLADEDFVSH